MHTLTVCLPTTITHPTMPRTMLTPAPLETSDPRYLRRLVKFINEQTVGVYLSMTVAGTEANPRLIGRASYSSRDNAILFPAFMGGGEKKTYTVTADDAGEAFMEGGGGRTLYALRHER